MSTMKKKPGLYGLPGKTVISNLIRRKLNLDEKLLTINVKTWSEPEALINDYFNEHAIDFASSGSRVYHSILETLEKIVEYGESEYGEFEEPETKERIIPKTLLEYSKRMHSYLKQKQLKTEFERFYRLKEVEARKKLEELYTTEESEVVGQKLTRKSIISLGKRTEREIETEKENSSPNPIMLKIRKNNKSFSIHHAESLGSTPNTPRLQQEDYEALSPITNIKYRSTTHKDNDDIEEIFNQARSDEKQNLSLEKIPGAIDLLKATALHTQNGFINKCLWEKENPTPFIEMMKYVISDYYQNCLKQQPYDFNDERTFFCEIIIPILKSFALHNSNISFKWCEKESKENSITWLEDSNYKPKNVEKRLLDGYGISKDKGIAVMVESSGSESNVAHSLEDSIKQIKSSTDFLSYLKARFKDSSAKTFTKIRCPTLLLIRNQLTMSTTSLNLNKKWQIIDVRTVTIPTSKAEKHMLVKLFELLAHLKEIWDEQQEVVSSLEAEAVGFGEPFEESVEYYFSNQGDLIQ